MPWGKCSTAAAQGSVWDVGFICFHIKFLLEMTTAPGSVWRLEQSPHPGTLRHQETSPVLPVWLPCPSPSAVQKSSFDLLLTYKCRAQAAAQTTSLSTFAKVTSGLQLNFQDVFSLEAQMSSFKRLQKVCRLLTLSCHFSDPLRAGDTGSWAEVRGGRVAQTTRPSPFPACFHMSPQHPRRRTHARPWISTQCRRRASQLSWARAGLPPAPRHGPTRRPQPLHVCHLSPPARGSPRHDSGVGARAAPPRWAPATLPGRPGERGRCSGICWPPT